MKKLYNISAFLTLLLAISFNLQAQADLPEKSKEERIYSEEEVDIKPQYKDGENAMRRFIGKNMAYPAAAMKAGVSGKVRLKLIIEKDGSVKTDKVLETPGFGCELEAQNVVKLMPKWIPAKKDGEVVRAYKEISVNFRIEY